MNNILFRLPPSAMEKILSASESPWIGKVSKKDGSSLDVGVPKYLVEPLAYNTRTLDFNGVDVQLVDFGSGKAFRNCSWFILGH